MFNNRAIQVKMVKDRKDDSNASAAATLDLDEVNKLLKDQVQNIALAVGGVLVANKALNTISQIAIITAQKKIK